MKEKQKEKAILVGVNLNNQKYFSNSIEELKNLTLGLNMDLLDVVIQNSHHINARSYIGSGKLQELKELVMVNEATVVIFNDELSGSQIKNIGSTIECHVIDRTQLILDIFSKRAKTKEAKLQIEIAQLKYRLPRLIGLGTGMARQRGGGAINRGAGETKLVLDRRTIEERIKHLDNELETIVSKRDTQRRLRKKNEMPIVALVGYTNSGKSTLLNSVVEQYQQQESKKVFEKDMLFATLDTSVRNITLSDNKQFLLTDTVGFIDKLPHDLIKAFRSTLEEVIEADLLIHVVDYANPHYKQQIEITKSTLKEIGIKDIPMITMLNKIDLVEMNEVKVTDNAIYLSAKEKFGIEELVEIIKRYIFHDYITCEMLIPFEAGNVIHYFKENANVLNTTYQFNGTKIELECREVDFDKYRRFVIS